MNRPECVSAVQKLCPAPLVEDSSMSVLQLGPFAVGSQVEVRCVEGFTGVGDMTLFCNSNQEWTTLTGKCEGINSDRIMKC